MKTFKQFLEEAANSIQGIRDKGFKLKKGGYSDPSLPDGVMRWGWQIKKAKLSKDEKLMKMYKEFGNPKPPTNKELGLDPLKKIKA